MGAVIQRYMKHLMLSLGLIFISSLSAQSVSYSPNQSVYCGASGQIVFSLDYNPNDSNKVYWTTNASFATFKLGIGGVDTLDWNGLISPQSVSIFVSDSSASPIFLDTLLLNFAPFPNPTLSIGSSFEKCSGSKTVTATPAGGQFYLDGQAVTLISGGQLDINGLDLGTHSLRYEVTSGGCTADITESFNITGFVFAPGQSSNIMFGEIFSSNFVPMSGIMYGGQLLFRKCSAVSGATFEIQTTGTFSQFSQIEIDWGDANITSQALSSSSPLAHSYTQAGMYDISVELSSSSNSCSLDTTFKVFFGANPNLNTGFVSSQNCILPGEDSILVEHIALYNFLNDINGYEYWFYSQIGDDTVKMKAPLVANGVPQYPNYLRLDDTLWYSHPFYEGSCGLPASNNKSNYYEVTVQLFSPCGSSFQILGPTPVTEAPNAGIIGPNQGCLNAEIEFDSHDSSGALVLAGNSPGTYNCSDTHVGVWMILAENGDTILPSSNIYTVQPGSSLGDVIGPLVNPAFWTLGTNVLKVVFHQPGYYKIVRTASLYDWERQNHVPCGLAMDTLEICIDEVPVAEFTNVLTDSVCTLDTLSANLLLDSINCSKLTTYRLDLYKGSVLVQNLLNSDTMHSTSFYAPSDYGEYFLKGTVSNDCGDSTVIDTFYVFEPVEVVPIETSSSYCRDSIVLEIDTNLFRVNTDSSNARLDSIQVNPSSGWEILASGEYRFNTYGTYNIKVFYKGFCNIDSAQCQLVLNAPPLAEFALSDSSGCSPFIPVISLLSNNVNYTHSWYAKNSIGAIVDSSFSTIPSFTLWNSSNTFDSTFTILHYVFDGTSSCIDSAYIPVYVYPDPSAGFSLPSPICAGDTVTVTDTSTGYGLNYRWLASGGVVISDTTVDEPMLFFPDNQAPTADSTYTITVIVTSDDGCKDTAVQNVLIHARPKANFGIDSVQCGSYVGVLTDSSQFNGSGPLNYSWSVIANISGAGAATLSSTSAASPTLSIPTPSVDSVTYRVTLVVTDSYGCTDAYLDSIKLYARPTATFSITPTDTCGVFDLTGKITDTSTNGFSTNTTAGIERRWLVERDNTLLYDSIRTSLDYVLTNTGVDDSVYTITLMVTNERGCMDSSSVDVTIYPDALARVDSLATLTQCAPFLIDSTVLKAVDFPDANATYTWTVLDSSSTSFYGRTGLNYLLSIPDTTLTVRLVVESDHGCKSDTIKVVITTIPNPDASFVINDTLGCSLFTPVIDTISASSNITHEWNIIDSSATTNMVVQTASTYQPSFASLGNSSATLFKKYWVQHIVTAGSGCIDSAYIPVYVYPDPSAGFSLPSPICAGDTVTVTDTSTGYGLNYRWLASGGVVISDTTVDEPMLFFPDNQAPTADSTYTITVIVTSDDGCKDTAVQNVLIHARPKANFGIDSVQCGSYVGVLTDSSQFNGSGPLNYSWSVIANISGAGAATLSSTSAASPTLSIPTPSVDSVTYRVTLVVTDSYGCTDAYLDSIKLYARPTATFSITPTDTCGVFDLTGKITDTSTNGFSTNTTAGIERRWLVERDNTLLYDSIRTSLDYVLTNTGVDDSVYTITLMVTNERGCMDSSSVDVTIYPDALAGLIVKSSLFNCAPFIVDTSVISAFEYPHANDTYTWNAYDSLSGSLVYGPVNGKDSLSFMLPAADSTVVIVLTTSNANGCREDSDTLIIGTLPDPEALFSFSQDTVCAGDSIYMSLITGNAQTTYDWYIDTTGNGMQYLSSGFSSFLTSLGNNGDTVLNQIHIKCVATQGITGCSDSTTLPLYVSPNPVPSFTQNLVCGLDTVELNGITVKNSLIQSWNWELGSSFLMGQKVNKYYGTAGYYNVILRTTTYDGCSRQVMDSIVVYDYPTADIAVTSLCAPDTICSGETIVFNDSSQTLGALQGIINSWGWDVENDGITESTLQNYSTSLNGFGFIDVELLVSNQFGCSDSIVKSAFIQVEPQANIQFALDTTCAPWQTSYVVQDTGYIDSSYFVLSALNGSNSIIVGEGEIIDSVVKTLQPNYLTDSIFTIAHTVWNCCGSSTDFDSIYLKTPPLADYATVPDTGCTPLTVTFVLQNRIRGNAIAAVLDFGNGRIDTITPQTVVSPSGIVSIWPSLSETYIYGGTVDTTYYTFLTVWNNCGDSTYSSAVNVRPNTVDALIDAPSTEGCTPLTVDFENLTSGANDYSWCFDWDGTTCNGGGSNSFEPSWTYSVPGSYVVAMFADNGCGYDTAYLEIEVNPSPTSMFTHNTPVCAKDSLILTNTSIVTSGLISVNQWTLDSLTTSQNQDLSYVITQGGSYEVSLMVESSNGCSDSSFQLVSINHNPEVNFSLNNACLNEQPVQFYDSTLVQGASINYTYWDFGDGNASIGLNPTHTYSQPGTYQVKLIKGSSQGCIDSMVQTITIYNVPETQFRAVLTSGDSCSVPQTYEFQNITPGAQAFLWDFDYLNAPGQYTSSQSTPSFTYVNSGVYLIRLVSYNAFGCTDTAYQTVVVNDGVVADFHVSPVNGCDPLTLNLYSQPIFNRQLDTISHVRWELSNGWTNNTADSVSFATIDQPGQYALSYFVYTNQGCSDSIIGQIINVYPTPEPDFIMSKVDIRTFDFINNGVYLDTTLQFLWSFGDGDTSNVFSPRHRYLQTTMMDSLQVCLIVRNSFNCFESICKPIFMWDYNLSVPNSIVPERTQFGEDALFLPKGHDLMNYTLSIFDKWGNRVFESTELNNGAPVEAWNGRLNNQGEILPMGAYVWKIEATFNDGHVWQGNSYSGENLKRYGTLMLIR